MRFDGSTMVNCRRIAEGLAALSAPRSGTITIDELASTLEFVDMGVTSKRLTWEDTVPPRAIETTHEAMDALGAELGTLLKIDAVSPPRPLEGLARDAMGMALPDLIQVAAGEEVEHYSRGRPFEREIVERHMELLRDFLARPGVDRQEARDAVLAQSLRGRKMLAGLFQWHNAADAKAIFEHLEAASEAERAVRIEGMVNGFRCALLHIWSAEIGAAYQVPDRHLAYITTDFARTAWRRLGETVQGIPGQEPEMNPVSLPPLALAALMDAEVKNPWGLYQRAAALARGWTRGNVRVSLMNAVASEDIEDDDEFRVFLHQITVRAGGPGLTGRLSDVSGIVSLFAEAANLLAANPALIAAPAGTGLLFGLPAWIVRAARVVQERRGGPAAFTAFYRGVSDEIARTKALGLKWDELGPRVQTVFGRTLVA